MTGSLFLLVLALGASLAGLLTWLGMAGAAQFTARREHGYLHWIIYVLLFLLALGSWLSQRDLTTDYSIPPELLGLGPPRAKPPLLALLQPALSLLLLALAGERILTHWVLRRQQPLPTLLLAGFVLFWLGSTASPAVLGAHPNLSHDYAYALVIGLAAAMAAPREQDLALRATRNGLLLLMLAGALAAPLQPTLVMDLRYGQGLIDGLPRFAGLASHAVSMGLLAQLGLLCLLARPLQQRGLNRLAWALGLGVLALAQSKTAWLAFALSSGVMLLWQHGPQWQRRLGDPLRPDTGLALALLGMAGVLLVAAVALFGNVGDRLDRFLNTPEGAQLASLTGRDRIWAIAWEEWARNPVFGYGPELWGEAYRRAIGMSSATHAHNQFMDTLSRAGTVGAAALLGYAALLLWLSLRCARATRGLSVALFLSLLLRAMSEVPLLLFGYGSELITHALLLMTLASAQARPAWAAPGPQPARMRRPGAQAPAAVRPLGGAARGLGASATRPSQARQLSS
jgi:O-antigen ligase